MKVYVPLFAGILGFAFVPGNSKTIDCNRDPDAQPYDSEFLSKLNTTMCLMDDQDTYVGDHIAPEIAVKQICNAHKEFTIYLEDHFNLKEGKYDHSSLEQDEPETQGPTTGTSPSATPTTSPFASPSSAPSAFPTSSPSATPSEKELIKLYKEALEELDNRARFAGCNDDSEECIKCQQHAYIEIAQSLPDDASDYTSDVCPPIYYLQSCLKSKKCDMSMYERWMHEVTVKICPKNGKKLRG